MFGLGWAELIILILIGSMLFGVPVVALLIALAATRRTGPGPRRDDLADLRDEVARLRDEVDALKRQLAQPDPTSHHVKGE